jgi:thiosulfate/3-mercaptopyruvate sulfurtransferase
MKVKSLTIPVVFLTLGILPLMLVSFKAQQKEPWTHEQLLEPQDLALTLNNPQSHQPLILSIGPAAIIKNSIDIGPTREKENLYKLERVLKTTPKDEMIVLYCGCCPFDKCPNIRPAFELLNQMQFKNHKLLNLAHNIKADWIDRGYPVAE